MTEPNSHPWAPKDGLRFFVLWVAGAVFAQIGYAAANIAWAPSAHSGTGAVTSWVSAIGTSEVIWCGWLIFRWNWRTLAWAVPKCITWMVTPLMFTEIANLAVVVVLISYPLVQYLALRGVRHQPAIWFAVVVAELLFLFGGWAILESRVFRQIAAELAAAIPASIPLPMSASFSAGLTVIQAAIGGAALAWLMPPRILSSESKPSP